MRLQAKFAITITIFAVTLCLSRAQEDDYRHAKSLSAELQSTVVTEGSDDAALSSDDRLSIIAAALDARVRRSERDCSHLVHAIYVEAGLPYSYAPSSQIYGGTEGFERVKQPQPGDLVVWRGHVGIVIKPSRHIFFSYMRSGPGTDDYEAAYWKTRGRPRFYRYFKNAPCEGCDSVAQHRRRLVKIKR